MRGRYLVALFGLLCATVLCGQQPAAKSDTQAYVPSMTFDVAVIRQSPPANSFTVSDVDPPHNSSVKLSNFDVANLIAIAYPVEWAQIVGLPDWTHGPLFNVEARADESVDERLAKMTDKEAEAEKQHMMQALLADRFKLKIHWETKAGPIYELVVAKNGPKLHPGGSMPPTEGELQSWGDKKIPPIHEVGSSWAGFDLIGHECSMDSLAQTLTGMVMGLPVVNKTGLNGTYDFDMKFFGSTEQNASDDPNMARPLPEALTDQLGLKLQSAKGEKQFLIIDHIERPSAN